jgi:hypothetical protein
MVGPVNRGFGGMEQGQAGPGTKAVGNRPESGGAAGVVESVKEKAQDFASGVASTAGDAWDSARQGVQQAYSAVSDTAGEAFGQLTDFMRRYPFATLLVGFGLGFLTAQAFSFRSWTSRNEYR